MTQIRHLLKLSFQSSPGAKTGCNVLSGFSGRSNYRFQSSPGAKTGCNGILARLRLEGNSFNPHPVQRPGATQSFRPPRTGRKVSILTRCKDRVQRAPPPRGWWLSSFNPHPVQRPGATGGDKAYYSTANVSILTRCKDRVQRVPVLPQQRGRRVSILTRCKDRVQRGSSLNQCPGGLVSILTRCKDRVQQNTFSATPMPA